MLQTIVDIVTQSFEKVSANFLQFLLNPVESTMNYFIQYLFSGMNSGFLSAFDNAIISAICTVANMFSWIILIFAFIFYLLKIAKEERRNWGVIFNCFFEAIIFVTLNQWVAKSCFFISCAMTDIFKYTVFDKLSWKDIAIPTSGFNGFTTLAVAIALIGFFVTTILRVANMFVQMLLAPLYVPYVLMGDQQKWIEWFLSVISVGFTYVIQYSVFYAGFMITYYSATDLTNKLIGIGLLFATFGVPKAMAKFGWSSGSANAFRSAGQTAATLLMRMPLK